MDEIIKRNVHLPRAERKKKREKPGEKIGQYPLCYNLIKKNK
jgi:hypothetical protein